MRDKHGNQLNEDSFADNSAHSSFRGFLTYKKGWKPKEPAVVKNLKSYLNGEGSKFHITGNVSLKNCLFADNKISVRYGVWNSGVTFEDSKFIGLSKDQKLRRGQNCPPPNGHGIRASMNSWPKNYGGLALKNVEFDNFICGTESITFYYDNRLSYSMGDPVQADNVTIVNSLDKNRPRLDGCQNSAFAMWFMEDFDGTLGPPGQGPGFLVRDRPITTAFFPEDSCESLSYDSKDCTTFCKDVCLRLVHIQPTGSVTKSNSDIQKLQLTNPATSVTQSYNLNQHGKAVVLLPGGKYNGDFLDSGGNPVALDTVQIETFRKPRCLDYVVESDITF